MKGKCALITGSTQGLGYAMAQRFAAEGCHIVLNGLGDKAEIEHKRRQLESEHGVRVLHHSADLADPGQIADLVETAQRTFGAVDILINNAVAPAKTPQAVVDKLHAEIVKALQNPDIKELLSKQAMQPVGNTPQEFAAFLAKDIAMWKEVATMANVSVE